MNERLDTLQKARSRMIEERDAFAKVLAAPFDRNTAERSRLKFRHAAPAGRPDLLIATVSGLVAWIITLALRTVVGS